MSQSTRDPVGSIPRTTKPRPLHGLVARDADGRAIGKVRGVYLDAEFGLTEWAAVAVGFLGRHEVLVPLADALVVGGDLRLGYRRDVIDAAPHRDPDRTLSTRAEEELFRHYGIEFAGETVTAAYDAPVLVDEVEDPYPSEVTVAVPVDLEADPVPVRRTRATVRS